MKLSNKRLEFETKPYFTYFQSRGALFGILQSCDYIKPWIYSKFIMCGSSDLETQDDEWLTKCGAIMRLRSKTYKLNSLLGIIDKEIRKAIDDNYYVYLLADEFYLPNKHPYKSYHYIHDIMIYAYDNNKEYFVAVGYDKNGIYKEYTISYKDIRLSTKSAVVRYSNSVLYRVKINTTFDFKFNYIDYCDGLYRYIKQDVLHKYQPDENYYGICSWKSLQQHIHDVISNKSDINIIQCKFIYEHKVFIYDQLKYINEFQRNDLQGVLSEYKQILDKTWSLFCLCLKYSHTKKKVVLTTCIDMIDKLFSKELYLLNNLLNMLIIDNTDTVLY